MAEAGEHQLNEPLDLAGLVRRHADDLYRYAWRLSGNQADAEDLVQQTFVQATTYFDSLREASKARSWLFTILRNAFFKLCKQRTQAPAVNAAMEVDEIPAAMTQAPIDGQALTLALNELSDEHRVVLVMYYFEELTYQEIAEKLDWPIGTVMSRLSRGKAKLRGRLAAQFPEWCEDDAEKTANDRSNESRTDAPSVAPWQ